MRSVSLIPPAPDPRELKNPMFHGSGAKLYWARARAHYLSNIWEMFVQNHFAAAVGGDVDLPYDIEKHLIVPPMFIEVPLLIGDCIRNLRSALDYLVSEMARVAGLSDATTVFPFASDLANLKASFNAPIAGQEHRKGRRAGALYDLSRKYPNLEKVILEDIQPYDAANGAHPLGDALWRIITSDNFDKHRLMTPSVQRTGANDIRLSDGGRISGATMFGGNMFLFPPGTKLDKKTYFEIDIIFEEPTRVSGKPVMSTLIQGCNAVGEVIEIFRREFGPSLSKS